MPEYQFTGNIAQQKKAVDLLINCSSYWKKISVITSGHYKEVPYIDSYKSPLNAFKDARCFSWKKFLPQVERDIMIAKGAIVFKKTSK